MDEKTILMAEKLFDEYKDAEKLTTYKDIILNKQPAISRNNFINLMMHLYSVGQKQPDTERKCNKHGVINSACLCERVRLTPEEKELAPRCMECDEYPSLFITV